MYHKEVSSPGNTVHEAKYKHERFPWSEGSYSRALFWACASRLWGLSVTDLCRYQQYQQRQFLPSFRLFPSRTAASAVPAPHRLRVAEGASWVYIDVAQQTGCMAARAGRAYPPAKALQRKREGRLPILALLPFSLTESASQSAENRSWQAAAYNPAYYSKPKRLELVTVQGDFLAVFHSPCECRVFPGTGRASSWGKRRSAAGHCHLRVKALRFH